jgi:NifB/MoaA-like Fe-S oxidoreductase
MIRSLAIVPVGLTAHRERLPALTPVDRVYAAAFLDQWLPEMHKLNKKLGEPFLQLADEFFLKAGYPFPPLKAYGDLPQWENGVGMVPYFLKEAAAVIKRAKPLGKLQATVATGFSAVGFVGEFLKGLEEKTGCSLTPIPIKNRLFGESVTVTGLIGGRDIIASLQGAELGAALLIPAVMLKEGEGVFLDDLTPKELSESLKIPVIIFDGTPTGVYKTLRKLSTKKGR